MVSPLEEYFSNQDFSPNSGQESYTAAEKLFMQKYLGISEDDLVGKAAAAAIPAIAETKQAPDSAPGYVEKTSFDPGVAEGEIDGPTFIGKALGLADVNEAIQTIVDNNAEAGGMQAPSRETATPPAAVPDAPESDFGESAEALPVAEESLPALLEEHKTTAKADALVRAEYEEDKNKEPSLESLLKQEEYCQMVGFFIGAQEFVIPTMGMQEVIRFEEPVRIPMAPDFVEGVITLRGKVTPVLNLRDMLVVNNTPRKDGKCIIICSRRGLQLGFVVEKIHTMYMVPQKDLEWGVEAQLGINSDTDFITAIMKSEDRERLISMVSVDKIIDFLLR